MKKTLFLLLSALWASVCLGGELNVQHQGKDLEEWLQLANEPDGPILTEVFSKMTPEEEKSLLPALTVVLQDKDPYRRIDALSILSQFRHETKTAVTLLIQALQDPNAEVPQFALSNLMLIARWAPDQKAELLQVFLSKTKDPDPLERGHALSGLGSLGKNAKSAIPIIIEALQKDPDEYGRESAAAALGKMTQDAAAVVPPLLEAARKDPEEGVRESAIQALWDLKAKDAIPVLEEIGKSDPAPKNRALALDFAKKLQP